MGGTNGKYPETRLHSVRNGSGENVIADLLKISDVVKLKSGDISMTVVGIMAGNEAQAWFAGGALVQTDADELTPVDALEHSPKPTPG
jgi:uncharacterized protein YodC (DUF2158 family)